MAGGLRGCFSGISLIRRLLLLFSTLLFTFLLALLRQYALSPTTAAGPVQQPSLSSLTAALPSTSQSIRHRQVVEGADRDEVVGFKQVPWSDRTRTDPAVLVVYKKKTKPMLRMVRRLLEAQRVQHRYYMLSPFRTPSLVRLSASSPFPVGRYSVIVVVDVMDLILEESVWMLLTDYCRSYRAGIVLMASGLTKSYSSVLSWQSPTGVHMSVVYPKSNHVHHMRLCAPQGLLNITRDGGEWTDVSNESLFIVFKAPTQSNLPSSVSNFEPIVNLVYTPNGSSVPLQQPVALLEHEGVDGVRKVYIGSPLTVALTKLVLLDAIKLLSKHSPVLRHSNLDRWILVDIDDTFVAPKGQKMKAADVQALISAQKSFRQLVPGFTFNLGYCGYYFRHGQKDEVAGDELLLANADKFWWFGHTYHHIQPHLVSPDDLRTMMEKNLAFAKNYSIPALTNQYSVAPHHSGVYPVYEALYTAWREVWNITVSSTEEYPHLRPDYRRRGFVHRGVSILPRQTCKLFTHINNFSFFAGGREELISFAEGGEVFDNVLNNPVAVFMTHTTNYAIDRVALPLFEHLFKFVRRWTNIQLQTERPMALAKRYFEIFPEDRYPLWTSPCSDHRHLEIWTGQKNCSRLPSIVILGPQKTGTTALYAFLKLHPDIVANKNTPHGFEEVQFFSNDDIYTRGVEWYMSNFPYPVSSKQVLFEKSATYFANPYAPERMYSLLPKAKLVIILADPIKRAYSWYHHKRAHMDQTALKYNFSEVIRADEIEGSSDELLSLRTHCLYPGVYHEHIDEWLVYYRRRQIHLIDGDLLVSDPVHVLKDLITALDLKQIDYANMIRFSKRKGYYCAIGKSNRDICLGKGKGRKYPPMSEEDNYYLTQYYSAHNKRLFNILNVLGFKAPKWILNRT